MRKMAYHMRFLISLDISSELLCLQWTYCRCWRWIATWLFLQLHCWPSFLPSSVCFCFLLYFYHATACSATHGVISAILSVCLSVWHMHRLWQISVC